MFIINSISEIGCPCIRNTSKYIMARLYFKPCPEGDYVLCLGSLAVNLNENLVK